MTSDGAERHGPLRVLLISPLRGLDPLSGDVTYTEQLLAAPPPGVEYVTYDEALRNGSLLELGTRKAIAEAHLRDVPRQLAIAAWRKLEFLIRQTGLVYREPLRIFSVKPESYDLVHVHVFHNRFVGIAPPVVMSAGGALEGLYRDAWQWSTRKIALANMFDQVVGAIWDATMCGERLGRATRMVTLSADFRASLVDRGWPPDYIDVTPNYLSFDPPPKEAVEIPRTLGFVAKDFRTKGGHLVLRAFEILHSKHPELRLLVVGSPRGNLPQGIPESAVEWLPTVPREELLHSVLPRIDILVYPTLRDTSVPYGPMEALAMGIPIVVSDYGAMPELVAEGAGRVCSRGEPESVTLAVEDLLTPEAWQTASAAAQLRYRERFSPESQGPALRNAYEAALSNQRIERNIGRSEFSHRKGSKR